MSAGTTFEDCFSVEIVKAYNKPMSRQTEEGTFMINIKGELLNSKTEWHQPKIIRTTIHTGGAELAGGRILPLPSSLPPSLNPQKHRCLLPPLTAPLPHAPPAHLLSSHKRPAVILPILSFLLPAPASHTLLLSPVHTTPT